MTTNADLEIVAEEYLESEYCAPEVGMPFWLYLAGWERTHRVPRIDWGRKEERLSVWWRVYVWIRWCVRRAIWRR